MKTRLLISSMGVMGLLGLSGCGQPVHHQVDTITSAQSKVSRSQLNAYSPLTKAQLQKFQHQYKPWQQRVNHWSFSSLELYLTDHAKLKSKPMITKAGQWLWIQDMYQQHLIQQFKTTRTFHYDGKHAGVLYKIVAPKMVSVMPIRSAKMLSQQASSRSLKIIDVGDGNWGYVLTNPTCDNFQYATTVLVMPKQSLSFKS